MAKIRDVEPRYGYRLLIELDSGNIIYLNLSEKVETVRFYDLKDEEFFKQVETDGYALYWDYGRISISLSEIYEMTRVKTETKKENKTNQNVI
ncbi:MAG: DUF2442 domain-containing protein [Lachnospiraceae bacterium]|nr:DUF2442 domain-containing protein [Lachnospiraceae bacterium]